MRRHSSSFCSNEGQKLEMMASKGCNLTLLISSRTSSKHDANEVCFLRYWFKENFHVLSIQK